MMIGPAGDGRRDDVRLVFGRVVPGRSATNDLEGSDVFLAPADHLGADE
jgi:hypothetical protein